MKKKINFILILLLLIECNDIKKQEENIITVDVTAKYPYKELFLQDFMDVEYVPLETTDEFLCQGNVWAVGEKIVVATNFDFRGNIFLFSRDGKALKKINRKGQGGEEYTLFNRIVLDEENEELFVNDISKKILVYDLEGNFKRKISWEGDLRPSEMYNFDHGNLICRNDFHNNIGQSFFLLSKQDGHITKEIQIPFEKKKSIVIWSQDRKMTYHPQIAHPIMPYFDSYALMDYSADTLYSYSLDNKLKPLIVRTPSIQSMNPEIYLLSSLFTERYYFMVAIEKTIEFSSTYLLYDKQEKSLFRYKVYNRDYSDYTTRRKAFLGSRPLNGEIPLFQYLEAGELIQDYESGVLKGCLKDIASKLKEDDNPVIMLIKYKK
ncbi:6-bladed beta-propeller [uncultured Parabacteroides sp.]|uniref:6-bladed beta-propeller n=1 Tax=uncultured Parabacteroides sp. TaxID=512312 RepID=UPI0026191FD8|nr:6-bladed beta-propeller [uncultured Parabacteroides sp.]